MNDETPINPFWTWSLAHYDEEGVAPLLVQLQDRFDLNVNILLWCLWVADAYDTAPDGVLKQAVELSARWRRDVSGALRTARRALKSPPREFDAKEASLLRDMVKKAELEAERLEQNSLARLAEKELTATDKPDARKDRARENLAAYAAIAGAVQREGFSEKTLADLVQRVFETSDTETKEPRR